MAQGVAISDEQIELVKATFAETGSLTASAKAAGVSISTAKKYADNRDSFEALRNEKRIDIIGKLTELKLKLIETMMEPEHLRRASFQELATALGISVDKVLLLTGQATSRVETGPIDPAKLTPEEREKAAALREKLAAG
jgi:hypothetical protein